MNWVNLLLAFLFFWCSSGVTVALMFAITPNKSFMTKNHIRIYWYGVPLLGILTNYDDLPFVSWGYFIGLSIGVGLMTFIVHVIMNQVTGFVNNLDHNKED